MNLRKRLWILSGFVCVALALVGIFVPVLPTTPFLLLAAFFFARSSERFYIWLVTNRWFGDYIRNYREGRGIPLREKVLAITALWLTIGASAVFAVPAWWMRLILLGIGLGVTAHLLKVKTYRPERKAGPADRQPAPRKLRLDED